MPTNFNYVLAQDCCEFSSHNAPLATAPAVLEQRVDVTTIDGETISAFTPSNEELLSAVSRMSGTPALLYRRMNFIGDIPREYAWTIPHANKPEYGGFGQQRMTFSKWLRVIEAEQLSGHAGPAGEPNLPKNAEVLLGQANWAPAKPNRVQ